MNEYPDWVTPATNTHCTATGCRQKPNNGPALAEAGETLPSPRVAATGTDLCTWHHGQFARVLGDLVGLWGDLSGAIVRRPKPSTTPGVQTSGVQDVGAFWNPHASAVLYELQDWTLYNVRTVIRDRRLPPPDVQAFHRSIVEWVNGERTVRTWTEMRITEHSHGISTDDPPRVALAALARWHAGWLSHHPKLGGSLLDDALNLRRQALAALDQEPVRRLVIKNHFCPHVIDTLLEIPMHCGAPLYATLRDPNSTQPSEILCSANPHHPQLPRDRWMEYAHGR